ncbi:MAG: zinc ABC transporter substrate-binding protein [Actinomycetota bacterium]
MRSSEPNDTIQLADTRLRLIRPVIALVMLVFLAGCGGGSSAEDGDGRLIVLATTGQIHDAVRNVAGDQVELIGLLGPGVDPHVYIPTEGDVSAFNDADVIFYNGLFLEAQMERILEQLASSRTVVAVGDRQEESDLIPVGDGEFDPHIWNDPVLWQGVVEVIRDTLVAADPDNGAVYEANAGQYLDTIADTHAEMLALVDRVPPDQRLLITAHDAFGYYARAYGFEVAGLQGLSTESEASTADVQQLADLIVSRRISAIFVETSVSTRSIEAVQAAVSAQGLSVEIGGSLFSDALGEEGHPAETYVGMLRHNTETIVNALAPGS